MTLKTSGVTRTVALETLNVFWQDRAYYWFLTKLIVIVFMVICLLKNIYDLLKDVYRKMSFQKDYELSQGTSHLLSVPLTLEYVRILSWSISFSFYVNCFPDDVLCKMPSEMIKNQICWKTFLFFNSYFLILKYQDLILKVTYSEAVIQN